MIHNYTCNNNCCTFKTTVYKLKNWESKEDWKLTKNKIVKAGSFIFDPETSKILLVQSRGQMWGPPKGTMQDNETYEECAIREVFEETGILLNTSQFLDKTVIKNRALYYITNLKENDIAPQSHIEDNDANGIGWFNVNCLNDLIEQNKININQHCRMLIKKFFRKNIL